MKLVPSAALVKQSLASHSWMGVLTGALMYLVCLSGTLAVLYPELERWEQPDVAESVSYDPGAVDRAYRDLTERTPVTHHMYVGLPTQDMPRTSVSTEEAGWFVNPDGSLGASVDHEWTHLLVNLHLYLHLPSSFGMIVVSALGVMLCGLIISGFIAHPRLFKDAFLLRLGGSRHLEQADIHNRLSVWGAPFHLMIGVTGAYFGLAALVSVVLAAAYFDGDQEALLAAAFGSEPKLDQPVQMPAIGRALTAMDEIAPDAQPFFVTVEEAGTPEQYLIVSARHAGRLIWAEQHRFDGAGNYLNKVGYSDGAVGRQAIFSVYRLHFGHFGGLPVQVVYIVLGLALTIVSVTGVNVWLARRRRRDYLNDVWTGLVWGTPAALTGSAVTQVLLGLPSTAVLWVALLAALFWTRWLRDEAAARRRLQAVTGALLALLVAGHLLKFGLSALSPAALGINATLTLTAAGFLLAALRPALLRRRSHLDQRNPKSNPAPF